MRNIYLTEAQFKKICRLIKEEEYTENVVVGTFPTPDEARRVVSYLKEKYGFSDYDCYVDGNNVVASIEKSTTDDDYLYELKDSLMRDAAKFKEQYKNVSESRK